MKKFYTLLLCAGFFLLGNSVQAQLVCASGVLDSESLTITETSTPAIAFTGGTVTVELPVDPTCIANDVEVTFTCNSDLGATSEYFTFTDESGGTIGSVGTGSGSDCSTIFTGTFTLSAASFNMWRTDGFIEFDVMSTTAVNTFCAIDEVTIDLEWCDNCCTGPDLATAFTIDSSCYRTESKVCVSGVTGCSGSYQVSLDNGANWEAGNCGTSAVFGGLESGIVRVRCAADSCPATSFLGWASACALPVEFVGLNAKYVNDNINLYWQTETEVNSDFFEVQRSDDGISFETIGTIEAAGNASQRRTYYMVDENPLDGVNFYRIKEVDFDGKSQLSDVVMVNTESGAAIDITGMFPNPTNGIVRLDLLNNTSNEVVVKVINLAGSKVMMETIVEEDVFSVEMDITELPEGVYFVTANNGERTVTRKLIKE